VFLVFASARLLAALMVGPAPPASAALPLTAIKPELTSRVERGRQPLFGGDALAARRDAAPPPCLGDLCQPRVSVPGYEPRYERPRRTEAVVLALERARLEPFATIGWALVTTGIRLDFTPAALGGPGSGGRGWGSVFLRIRLRMDAYNTPIFPQRPR